MTGQSILTAAQMRAAEQALFASGVAEYDVMVRASRAVADMVWRVGGRSDVLVLCGPGNNGGDGYGVARYLRNHGVPVRVAALADPVTSGARQARKDWGGPVEDMMTAASASQLVDALFGTGLSRGLNADVAARLCDLASTATRIYAVDLPSGVASDSGAILSPVPHYDLCLSLGAWKPAHMLRPAALRWDRMLCLDIGIDAEKASVKRLEKPQLNAPADDAHKYRRGLVAVIAGEMAGAAALSAEAAARGGAGYVRLVGAQAIVSTPHAIVRTSARDETALTDPRIAALLIGPGLGRGEGVSAQLNAALSAGHPMVLDADALWLLSAGEGPSLPAHTILTPHEAEFARLFPDCEDGSVLDRACAAARRSGAVVLLKGSVSVVAAPDGRAMVADRAPSWLSTAGTGDVLAGLCASRLAVTGDPFTAAGEALWLHGEAARRAGPAFIADDLLHRIGSAIKACL